ncbi:MAG: outer membrane protein assembly factor BamD [Acidobacteriaceae bacterium]
MKRFVAHRIPSISAACLFAVLAGSATFSSSADAQIFHRGEQNKSKKATPADPLAGVKSKQPDKELFDKALAALKKGKYDIARLDLQTLLNTYPESEYQMRAKLAVGDTWFKEGGTAALTQAESEYKDFITFFPNTPEAAEAQMKVADIYYMQMEKPDRDVTNAERAEQEYRLMVQQFPDSTLVPRAKQRLREVQEVLAQRQFTVGSFYATHENWAASIARLQTLVDSYPLFSHSDMALLQLGDDYAAESKIAAGLNIDRAAKERLIATYDDRAAEAYAKVVTRYPMAAHVEDARERLIGLGRPVPEPSSAALAENEAEEQSRVPVKLKDRAMMLVKHGPSTVDAARVGEPTMTTPKVVTAPEISKENVAIYNTALAKPVGTTPGVTPSPAVANGTAAPRTGDAAPMRLEAVPEGGGTNSVGATVLNDNGAGAPATTDNNSGTTSTGATPPAAKDEGTSAPADTGAPLGGATAPNTAPNNGGNNGLSAVGPTNTAPLPALDKPAESEMQVNDVKGGAPAQVQTGTTASAKKKKSPKVKTDQNTESSSKQKKKKGLDKLNPF